MRPLWHISTKRYDAVRGEEDGMNRREFTALLGGAAAPPLFFWPFDARAQHAAMPVVGVLNSGPPQPDGRTITAFKQGLRQAGFVDGQNLAIEYRWADDHYDRLPALAAELVRHQVAVIFANTASAPVAKAATATIPIVFQVGSDPVKAGLVGSLNQPGGNLTGMVSMNAEVGPKRLELMHELVPTATSMALLVNPANPIAETLSRDGQLAAHTLGLQLQILRAGTETEIDAAFSSLAELRAGAVVIGPDAFFFRRSAQLAALATRYGMPSISPYRQFADAGGLMSYGGSSTDAYRLTGIYAGRILKGEKPANMPVQQLMKVEFVVNLKTAKALGVAVSLPLLGRADEVIE
jgi:putative ABC transport system substrate-binding protein